MSEGTTALPENALRDPDRVMRLAQLGAMFPTRLSFLRVLLRHLAKDGAQPKRVVWEIDPNGHGHAVYTISIGGYDYALVAFSHALPDDQRTDRVIATAWDAAFVLYDGIPDASEIARLKAQAPLQEGGRFTERDLILSRANKSVRLWSEVVSALKAGDQPNLLRINDIGYLMRTTAVYGNGKFGIADRACIAERPGFAAPFQAEMLTVWMIRTFTHDLIEHVAGAPLDREIKRHLGIGNATGLGMAPFLVFHPVLLNNWMVARETAFARVRAVTHVTEAQAQQLRALSHHVLDYLAQWQVAEDQAARVLGHLIADFSAFAAQDALWSLSALQKPGALNRLAEAAAAVSRDVEEVTLALMLEPFPDLVNDLADTLADQTGPCVAPVGDTQALRDLIEKHCAWALEIDHNAPENCAQFWYVSVEKQEPRLGLRFEEEGADLESPLDIARCIAALWRDLPAEPQDLTAFLTAHPAHLLAVERVQIAAKYPYADVRDSLIAQNCRPIDLLRAKLAMFGASKFDPKSDLWTRVTLCQGAPLADELIPETSDNWWLATASYK